MGGSLTSFRGVVVQWAIDQLDAGKIPAQIDIDEITNDPPPPGLTKAGRLDYIRSRTHVELEQ